MLTEAVDGFASGAIGISCREAAGDDIAVELPDGLYTGLFTNEGLLLVIHFNDGESRHPRGARE